MIAAILVAAAAASWWVGGQVADRAAAARVPLPDIEGLPPPVRDQIVAADAAARARPSAATFGELARVYHGSEMSLDAQQVYALAEQKAPRDWQWPYYRGLLHEERGEHKEALIAFERATTLNPQSGLAWFHVAEIRAKQGDVARAKQAYQNANQSPAPLFATSGITRKIKPLTSHVEERSKRLENAGGSPGISDAASVPPADPMLDAVVAASRDSDVLLKHAALAGRAGDMAWREFLARRALEFNPGGLDVLLEMASMLEASGKPAEALEYLRKAEQQAPGDHHVLVQYGRALADLDRLPEAEAVLLRAVRVRDAAAEYNLGRVLDRQGRAEEARARYERALAIDPFHARALNNLAMQLDRRGQTAAALDLYARAVQAAPRNAEILSNMGIGELNRGQLQAAIDLFRQALQLQPGFADAHNNLGLALAQAGKINEAIAEFREALRYAPRHANARRNLDQLTAVRP